MKDNIDLISITVGFFSAFMKAIKKGLTWKSVIVASISGAIFSWGIIGVLILFFNQITNNTSIIIAISFIIGRITDSVVDKLDVSVEDFYDIFIEWLRDKLKLKK